MNLEVGKYYKTASGEKVRVLCTDAPGKYPVVGLVEEEGDSYVRYFSADGQFSQRTMMHLSIVSEWREPVKVKGWVNVYEDFRSEPYPSRAEADRNQAAYRIACVWVSGTEGDEP